MRTSGNDKVVAVLAVTGFFVHLMEGRLGALTAVFEAA
jgi:hypothetical protein